MSATPRPCSAIVALQHSGGVLTVSAPGLTSIVRQLRPAPYNVPALDPTNLKSPTADGTEDWRNPRKGFVTATNQAEKAMKSQIPDPSQSQCEKHE